MIKCYHYYIEAISASETPRLNCIRSEIQNTDETVMLSHFRFRLRTVKECALACV